MSVHYIRIRSDTCPEPLEKQKVKYLKSNRNVIFTPILDKEWINNLLNKYFGKEIK